MITKYGDNITNKGLINITRPKAIEKIIKWIPAFVSIHSKKKYKQTHKIENETE